MSEGLSALTEALMARDKRIAELEAEKAEREKQERDRKRRIVTVPGHGELSPDEEEQMIAFMEYIFEKRKKGAGQ